MGRRLVILPAPVGPSGEAAREWIEWQAGGLGGGWSVVSNEPLRRGDIPVFWKKADALGAPARVRRRALVVDPLTVPAAGDVMGLWMAEETGGDAHSSRERLLDVITRQGARRALLFGSGPRPVLPEPREGDVHIYLGSTIQDTELCERFPPHFIVAADGASQFERNRVSEDFRRRAETLVSAGAVLVAPDLYRPILTAHWQNEVARTAVWVPRVERVPPGHSLSATIGYEPTSNVLTALGLPLAAALAKEIVLTGISVSDVPSKTEHWTHGDEAAYQREVADIVGGTPGSVAAGDYKTRHFARLGSDLHALTKSGCLVATPEGPLEVPPTAPPIAPKGKGLFAILDWLDHHPETVWVAGAVFAGLGITSAGRLLMGTITLVTIMLALALLAGLVALVLYLRVRMARMVAETEARLAAQQAQQFRNLSIRLEALEKNPSGSGES